LNSQQIWAAWSSASPYDSGVTAEQELVHLFGVKGRELDALRELAGGVTATYLRTVRLSEDSLAALIDGLSDSSPRVRWWCIQVLDHVSDVRSVAAIVSALDDPVARVRRNAAHALGCGACKPDWDRALPTATIQRLMGLAEGDPSDKVRREAAAALACVI
jgi:HEAT repeat protein